MLLLESLIFLNCEAKKLFFDIDGFTYLLSNDFDTTTMPVICMNYSVNEYTKYLDWFYDETHYVKDNIAHDRLDIRINAIQP